MYEWPLVLVLVFLCLCIGALSSEAVRGWYRVCVWVVALAGCLSLAGLLLERLQV